MSTSVLKMSSQSKSQATVEIVEPEIIGNESDLEITPESNASDEGSSSTFDRIMKKRVEEKAAKAALEGEDVEEAVEEEVTLEEQAADYDPETLATAQLLNEDGQVKPAAARIICRTFIDICLGRKNAKRVFGDDGYFDHHPISYMPNHTPGGGLWPKIERLRVAERAHFSQKPAPTEPFKVNGLFEIQPKEGTDTEVHVIFYGDYGERFCGSVRLDLVHFNYPAGGGAVITDRVYIPRGFWYPKVGAGEQFPWEAEASKSKKA